uniref:Regulatory factor X2 n=1 Tax=Pseudonaja textilis TaxID=8673 RepID=A0A670ZKK7_PSETE
TRDEPVFQSTQGRDKKLTGGSLSKRNPTRESSAHTVHTGSAEPVVDFVASLANRQIHPWLAPPGSPCMARFGSQESTGPESLPLSFCRYRPSQKLDGATEGGSISAPHTTPEESVAAQCQHHQQYIDVTHVLPEFPVLNPESVLLQEGIETRDLQALQLFYRRHCEANVEVVVSLQLPFLEKLWRSFWNSESIPSRTGASAAGASSEESYEAILPRHQLIALCKHEPILAWMRSCDHLLYQTLVEILIPDVLRPVPGTLTQAIRNFAKSLEGWLMSAMSEFPQPVVQSKVSVVSAFAQTLRRYTSLNHLAQAARAVLQNTSQINQMLSDLNRVDFANVQEQASWVCQCEEGLVQKLEHDFKVTLQQQSSLDQWARWLGQVVSQVLKPHEGAASFPRAARQFLLKWSFYSSMVIRDLTLRSAASFGSFHLIRLLYDEYMFYLVEHRVAEATGETPIAVMGEVRASSTPERLQADRPPVHPSEVGKRRSRIVVGQEADSVNPLERVVKAL